MVRWGERGSVLPSASLLGVYKGGETLLLQETHMWNV